ncbi:MAG: Sec-independent protein translocase protein TatB [Bauldia sp.]
MFDLNFTELLVVGLVAIVVVGPKELPQLMRTVGNWVGKVKRMGRDFQRQLNDAVRDEELAALQKQVADLSRTTDADIRRGLNPPDRHAPVNAAGMPRSRAAALERAAMQPAALPAPVAEPLGEPVDVPDVDVPAEPLAANGAKP